MRTGKKALLLIVGMMALTMVLLQTGCKDEEAERQKAEAERQAEQARKDAAQAQAAATWNQMEIEKAKALQAQRDIEQAKAKQAEENRINSDEWRATIWKIGKWVLGILALGVVLFFAPIIWEETMGPVIAKRQELSDRHKHAELYATQERALASEAWVSEAEAQKAEEQRKAHQAELWKAEELRKAETAKREAEAAKAKQLEEQRLIKQADAKKIEEERLRQEAEVRKLEEQRRLAILEAQRAERLAAEQQAQMVKSRHEAEVAVAREKETGALARQAEAQKAEAERVKTEEERKKAQAEAKKESARLAAAEIERQNKLKEYPLGAHVDVFCQQVGTLNGWITNGEEENRVFDLYLKLQAALEAASKIPLKERERIAEQHKELNQVETLMNLYSEKIRRVRDDEDLDDEEREEKIAYWRDMRNRQIAAIQGE